MQSRYNSRLNRIYSFAFASLVLLLSASVGAAESEPSDFIRGTHEQLTAVLKQPKSESREKRVLSGIDEVFDYSQLAERSLGSEWKARTDAERKQFTELLEGLVRQSYRKSIDSTLGWQVDYRGKKSKEGEVVVATVAKHKNDLRKAPVSVEYTLVLVERKWRVVDVTVEGSSLVGNYKSQFVRIIKKKGFAELISKMKTKLAKGEG